MLQRYPAYWSVACDGEYPFTVTLNHAVDVKLAKASMLHFSLRVRKSVPAAACRGDDLRTMSTHKPLA